MCIAILNKTAALPYEYVRQSWENNNDGAGLLWVGASGKMEVFKEATSLKKFWKKYKEVRAASVLPVVLHFRIGTSGNFADYNLHPFLVNDALGFVHNGIIKITEFDARFSDTYHFNQMVLQTMKRPARVMKTGTPEANLVSHFCGTGSKLVFLDSSGAFRIFNEAAGHWDKFGNWFSNSTYKVSRYIDRGGVKVEKPGAGSAYGSYGSYGSGSLYGSYGSGSSNYWDKSGKAIAWEDLRDLSLIHI